MTAHKYHAKACVIDGHKFPSLAEGRRYRELRLLEAAGKIKTIELHPAYSIEVNGQHICNYIADFSYFNEQSQLIVEDVKGVRTPEYRLKKKLMLAVYGITIMEIRG